MDTVGFQIAEANLPVEAAEGLAPDQDTPEVVVSEKAHFDALDATALESEML